jgi:hypothetical protein
LLALDESGRRVSSNDALAAVVERVVGSGLLASIRCSAVSEVVDAPLVRPFYLVVFVGEGGREGALIDGPVAGLRRVDAISLAVTPFASGDGTPSRDNPASAAELCNGLRIGAVASTRTELPIVGSLG